MSKGQKLLATYITDNYDKAVFLTAAKMGETVGVSESTVVRFATSLGYKGYPEFQKALEELVRNKLNSIQRMEVTYGRISQSKILETVLQSDADKIKTFIDTFPAGTLSGAPKVRAMQLISEIEPHNRGAYGGCIGFIGLNGELNQAITIRTFVSRNNELWFQAGGGIVARSQDEYELQEVNNKLGALKKAIDLAVQLKN